MSAQHRILFYDYVPDMMERRGPHREGHLAHIGQAKEDGRIVMAGAVGDPPHGGVIVFRDVSAEDIQAWSREDPYVQAGLVSGSRVEVWNVV